MPRTPPRKVRPLIRRAPSQNHVRLFCALHVFIEAIFKTLQNSLSNKHSNNLTRLFLFIWVIFLPCTRFLINSLTRFSEKFLERRKRIDSVRRRAASSIREANAGPERLTTFQGFVLESATFPGRIASQIRKSRGPETFN